MKKFDKPLIFFFWCACCLQFHPKLFFIIFRVIPPKVDLLFRIGQQIFLIVDLLKVLSNNFGE
jgi:hypothetical protein